MKKSIVLFFIFIFSFACITFGQTCQNLPQSLVIRGFSLGMTQDAIKKKYPKIEFYSDLDVVGLSNTILDSSHSFDGIFTETEREGLESIELTFFDKKLSQIKVIYNGFTEWDSLLEFTDVSAKALKLPSSENWQKTSDKNAIQIGCKNFFVVSKLSPAQSRYELQEPSLFFSLDSFASDLEKRRNTQKENQKKIFKP